MNGKMKTENRRMKNENSEQTAELKVQERDEETE